jgi:hypothetical protein
LIALNSAQIEALSQQYGAEPVLVLAINFTDYFVLNNVSGATTYTDNQIATIIQEAQSSSTIYFYSDKVIYNSDNSVLFPGGILSCSPINSFVSYSGETGTSDVTVKIDDSNKVILSLLSKVNIQKVPAFFYLYFDGLSVGDMIAIYEGEIVSGFSWSDKDLAATFTIMNRIEQKEVGFTPEQGYISDLIASLIGKPWPVGYGTVIKYPALKLYNSPTCTLTRPWGFHDGSLPNEIARLYSLHYLYYGIALLDYLGALQAFYSGLTDLGNQLQDEGDQAIAILSEVMTNRESLQQVLEEMAAFEGGMPVISNIPVKLIGTWEMGGYLVYASYRPVADAGLYGGSGVGYLDIIGALPEIGDSLIPYSTPSARTEFVFIQAGTIATFVGLYSGTYVADDTDYVPTGTLDTQIVSSGFDTEPQSIYPMLYVVNCLGGTVQGVYATRPAEGSDWIMPVPKAYWKAIKINTNPGGVVTTSLNFQALGIYTKVPLSSIPGVRWSDDIYVSFKSTIGPNIQDILTWLINNYTQFSPDPDSLAALPPFNCSFCEARQIDVMVQIKEICFQCNIAVWLSEGFFYFNYLPNFTAPVMSCGLSDIIADTLEIGITPTENIVTKIKAAWFTSYEFSTKNYLQIRYNDFRYGLHELDVDYYCFQDATLIMNSMSFWIYRKGNTWKRLKFSLPLRFIQLQIFDNLHIDMDVVALYLLGNGVNTYNNSDNYGVDASVISVILNPDTYLIEVELELPIYVGSSINSPAYWMSQSGGLSIFQIDENYDLTPKPDQILQYQRGESISLGIANASLAYAINNQFNNLPVGQSLWITQPDSVSGTPLTSGFDLYSRSDVGGPFGGGGYTGQTASVPQSTTGFSQVQPKPAWDYNYINYPGITSATAPPATCIPGQVGTQISDGSGGAGGSSWNVYNAIVYAGGLTKPGTPVTATLLGNPFKNVTVPIGTWALFSQAGSISTDSGVTSSPDDGGGVSTTAAGGVAIGGAASSPGATTLNYYFQYDPIADCIPGYVVSIGITPPGLNFSDIGSNIGVGYNCMVYANGLGKPPIPVVAVLMQDAENDNVIPAGTWYLFGVDATAVDNNSDGQDDDGLPNYFFQTPLWIA